MTDTIEIKDLDKLIEAIEEGGGGGGGSSVPAVTSSDDGKILTASYEGGEGSYSWEDAPNELPDATEASIGDVLSIGEDGLEWSTPSSGGGGAFDTLWSGSETPSSPDAYAATLSAALTNYDCIMVEFSKFALSNPAHTVAIVPIGANGSVYYATGYDATISVTFTDSTHISLAGTTSVDVTFYAVKGIKY